MLTDEDLIRELETAFRDETDGLTYAGRVPTPRRPVVPWTAVPVAAATAAVVVLPQLGGGAPGTSPAPPSVIRTVTPHTEVSAGGTPSTPGTTGAPVELVSASFEFAGRTFTYQHPAGEGPRYVLCQLGVDLPDDVTPIDHPYDLEKAWSGTDPETGDPAVWAQDSRYFRNRYVEMSSPFFTEQELVTMLQSPPDQEGDF